MLKGTAEEDIEIVISSEKYGAAAEAANEMQYALESGLYPQRRCKVRQVHSTSDFEFNTMRVHLSIPVSAVPLTFIRVDQFFVNQRKFVESTENSLGVRKTKRCPHIASNNIVTENNGLHGLITHIYFHVAV